MATLYKEHTVTPGTFVSVAFTLEHLYSQGAQADPPIWFDWIEGEIIIIGTDYFTGYEFTAPITLGTYDMFFRNSLGTIFYIRINVVATQFESYSNCCGDRNITWLNIQGGWQNYIFTGIKTFQVDVGNKKQFKTNQYVSKLSQVEGVFNGEIITSGDIPQHHVDALDGLKYSVQAFLYNDETGAWDIPILIDSGSFTKYKSRDKFFDVKVRFIYAEEILVQTQ